MITSEAGGPTTFTAWLLDQADSDDPVGDLARDARDDPNFPRGSPGECPNYLAKACRGGAKAALMDAVAEYLPS